MSGLPNDPEIERIITGACLLNPALSGNVLTAQLYDERHRYVMQAIKNLVAAGAPVDIVTVRRDLETSNRLEKVTPQYLASLTEGLPRPDTIAFTYYVGQLAKLARQRKLISSLNNTLTAAMSGNGDLDKTIADHKGILEGYLIDENEEGKPGFHPPKHWELLDVAEVENWKCVPLEWIVEPIVARGNFVIVAADTQCGKTLIALYVILHVLTGGSLFGKFPITPVNKVLYLLLEDPSRRAKKRLLDMRRDIRVKPGQFMVYVAPGLTISDDTHFGWLRDYIEKGGYDLVVIDTYQKATPGISSFDDVKQGPILHRLANLTRELNVTLWVHDHYRKDTGTRKRKELDLSSLKGTGGKPQNADCYILMERAGDTIKVLISTKDGDQKPRFMLNVSPEDSDEEKFTYAGDLAETASDMKAVGEANRKRVLDAIPENGNEVSRDDICRATGLKDNAVKNHLRTLLEQKDSPITTNGRASRAIRYKRFGRSEMASRPNDATQEFALN